MAVGVAAPLPLPGIEPAEPEMHAMIDTDPQVPAETEPPPDRPETDEEWRAWLAYYRSAFAPEVGS